MIIITLELTALAIDGEDGSTAPARSRYLTMVTVTFDERAIGAYNTRDGAGRYLMYAIYI